MPLNFDISPDEMPLFMAETEDHLQVLEEGLVKLEQEVDDPELIQALFRSAHTLKGMAGMIGHSRLVKLTHALETGFDGIRKKTFSISSNFIDICLKSIDALRTLREEVIDLNESNIDVEFMVEEMDAFIRSASGMNKPPEFEAVIAIIPAEIKGEVIQEATEQKESTGNNKKKKTSNKPAVVPVDLIQQVPIIKELLIAPTILEETEYSPVGNNS